MGRQNKPKIKIYSEIEILKKHIIDYDMKYLKHSDLINSIKSLKKELLKYRKNNDLWRKEPDILLSEFIEKIDEAFEYETKK